MFEMNGKYGSAKIYTDMADAATIGQVQNLLNQPASEGTKIRIMPDCHAGTECVIGTTMELHGKVIPAQTGADIGCFTGDTKVWCSAGYYQDIRTLAENGRPFMTDSFDEETHAFCTSRAVARLTRKNAALISVTYTVHGIIEKDVCVRCTPDHRFLVCTMHTGQMPDYRSRDCIWLEADRLTPGMQLVADDNYVTVRSVSQIPEREDVYCLTVDETHNFTISYGVIVHNCGMLTVQIAEKEQDVDPAGLDEAIRKYVPSGFDIHETAKYSTPLDCRKLACYGKRGACIDEDRAYRSVGTLGGGNHFIELDRDHAGNLYLVIHTGSRHIGVEVTKYYQDLAWERASSRNKNLHDEFQSKKQQIIEKLKQENRQTEIHDALERMYKDFHAKHSAVIKQFAYVEDQDFSDYVHDMKMIQEHARANRSAIASVILSAMGFTETDRFETIHNYIDTRFMIVRKGAVSAQDGEKILIPMNMQDGSLICIGNPACG